MNKVANLQDPKVREVYIKNKKAFFPMWKEIGEKALIAEHYDLWISNHPEYDIVYINKKK